MPVAVIKKAFKFRICKPTKLIQSRLVRTLQLCRFLYNSALQERRDAYRINQIKVNYHAQCKQLPEIKKNDPEFKEIYSQVLQDVLKRLDRSFEDFFRRASGNQKAGFPRFKGKNRFNSFCYTQSGFSLAGNRLTLSKIGIVKLKLSRQIEGKIKTLTIKNECGKWFAIFTVETKKSPLPKTGKYIGIDAGIENFITLSDGTQVENFKYYESSLKELRRKQRSVSRKKKDSNNRKKALFKLRKFHQKIKNRRIDFQHKLSTQLVKQYDVIAIEKLNLLCMSKGFLSKQIQDVSWSSFFAMLRYKVENTDKQLIEVNPNYTSQTCICGHRKKKTLSQRQHICSECGYSNHRDIVAAQIILSLGLRDLELT